ncbi:MAG: 2-succinyl-5-enolpyruvyl-6-hydroxy-3-cyclohexene-1-carboxylic-acid synthase [Flavobacteriaceae bacterium]|nr:2-succinyl-5-enolpyruvyl-6-hydroxy-3-cyclohexene-1-carboxylic-acid synthase [Flavobacteriaceae bacterium]
MYPKKDSAQLLISAVHQFDIDTVVISPGSRNAPLTVGFSNHPEIKALSIVDERCAAFFALGIAQQTKKPVAIVCTSGSALLNYYPAIAEAYYSNIPLVVISADRPKELIGIGNGQTIKQENVFANHILFSANLEEGNKVKNLELVVEALQIATNQKGPVHINIPFEEPLYETVEELKKINFSDVILSGSKEPQVNYNKLASIWNSTAKKLILVGVDHPDKKLQEIIAKYAQDPSVIVLTETTSNLPGENYINSIDKVIFSLNEEQFKRFHPEVLMTLGGMVVSKKIKQLLRTCQPMHHWHIDEFKSMDTYHCLSEFIQVEPMQFLQKFGVETIQIESKYQQNWLDLKNRKSAKHQQYLEEIPHSDLKSFELILSSMPNDSQLQLGNSSVIRYSQLYDLNNTLEVFCNRGTSGIDGCTSTAIGAAFASNKQTVFITGDLSFFYDSNALWNNYIPKNFRILLINNSGGGIFRFIPGPKSTNALDYFVTPHKMTAEQLSKMYDFEYRSASDTNGLQNSLTSFYAASEQPKILEVFTDKDVNDKVLKEYFNFIK